MTNKVGTRKQIAFKKVTNQIQMNQSDWTLCFKEQKFVVIFVPYVIHAALLLISCVMIICFQCEQFFKEKKSA